VPVLPGCFVDAETLEEAMADIQEVIRLFLASYSKHGDSLPSELSTITESDLPQSLKVLVSVQ
jgi:predicted RNase H-like HicB family nuclease